MATSVEESEKRDLMNKIQAGYSLPFGEKIVKIGPVDTEIALLRVKKNKEEEINASKIYSPLGSFVERAKICRLFCSKFMEL